jgi:hypothetical protein
MLFSISSCSLLKNVVDDPDKEEQEEETDDTEKTKKTEKTEKTTEETAETTKPTTKETGEANQEIQDLMAIASVEFDKVESYCGTMSMLMDADLTMDATGAQNMVVEMDIDYEYYEPTNYMYADYQMRMVQGAIDIEMPMSFYIIEDNGTKMYLFSEDVWTDASSMAGDYSDMVGNSSTSAMFEVISAGSYGLEITDDAEQFNGQDVYTITGELTGDALKMLFENSSTTSATGTTIDFTKMNFDDYNVPIVLKVYKESNLLAFFSYDMVGMLEDILTDSLATSGYSDIVVLSKAYQASVSFSDYNSLDNPTIPAEVLAAVS